MIATRRLPAPRPHQIIPRLPVEVDAIGSGLGRVTATNEVAHCHHRPGCLTALNVDDVVVLDGPFWSLLEHITASAS